MSILADLASGWSDAQWKTDMFSCFTCYNTYGAYHCIDDTFTYSVCCDYRPGSTAFMECVAPYNFCTYGLTKNAYKVFTCPPNKCPED